MSAVSCANYGLDVSFVSRLPKNDISDWCIRTLRQSNVDTRDIVYGGDRNGASIFLKRGSVSPWK